MSAPTIKHASWRRDRAALMGGEFTLVRDFQPLNWSNGRTARRLVRHMVDDLKGIHFLQCPSAFLS
jgi:hypothetical protein